MFQISVVVPCYNAEGTLGETLSALAGQQWQGEWEVLVVDNLSTDRSIDVARQYEQKVPNLRILSTSQQGTPYAINEGVKSAQGESVLFCDSDDVPAPGWLSAMAEALKENEFVACRMDVVTLNDARVASSRRNAQTEKLQLIGYPPYMLHAGGGTLGVRRSIFLEVGGYDPALIYLHDTDFCFKVQKAGYELNFVPDAVMQIRFRSDESATFRQARNWAAYNVLLAKRYRKDGAPPPDRWRRFFRDGIRITKRALKLSRLSAEDKVRAKWQIGWYLGKVIGVVKFRAAPF